MGVLSDLNEEVAELQAKVERLKRANTLLHDATIVLRNGMGGHNHWDSSQRSGAGCPTCTLQREARKQATELIERAAAEAAKGGEGGT